MSSDGAREPGGGATAHPGAPSEARSPPPVSWRRESPGFDEPRRDHRIRHAVPGSPAALDPSRGEKRQGRGADPGTPGTAPMLTSPPSTSGVTRICRGSRRTPDDAPGSGTGRRPGAPNPAGDPAGRDRFGGRPTSRGTWSVPGRRWNRRRRPRPRHPRRRRPRNQRGRRPRDGRARPNGSCVCSPPRSCPARSTVGSASVSRSPLPTLPGCRRRPPPVPRPATTPTPPHGPAPRHHHGGSRHGGRQGPTPPIRIADLA